MEIVKNCGSEREAWEKIGQAMVEQDMERDRLVNLAVERIMAHKKYRVGTWMTKNDVRSLLPRKRNDNTPDDILMEAIELMIWAGDLATGQDGDWLCYYNPKAVKPLNMRWV